MSSLLAIRDSIRDFLRKFDEITTPLIHFVLAYIMFASINSLFGYSEFLSRGIVVFLLSVICALVSSPVVVLLGGLDIAVHCFSVSVDVGILFVLFFIVMFCAYMRMFPDSSFALALVPILFLWHMPYAAPVIIAIFAGFAGAVPAAFGVAIYYFGQYVGEAHKEIMAAVDPEFQGYTYIVNHMAKNKEMFLFMIVFALVVMLTALLHRMSFDYAWYVAIAVGSICTILFFLVCGMALDVEVSMGGMILGVLLGGLVATIVQMCKSVADYAHKESVQFEDDDYYYYVKAIPKFNVASKKVNVKKITGEDEGSVARNVKNQVSRQGGQNANRQGQNRPQGQNRNSNGRPNQGRPNNRG